MSNELFTRISSRLEITGLSARAASLKAVGNPDLIRNLKRQRSASPRAQALSSLAAVLGVTETWLLTGQEPGNLSYSQRNVVEAAERVLRVASGAPLYLALDQDEIGTLARLIARIAAADSDQAGDEIDSALQLLHEFKEKETGNRKVVAP